jgi:hypothetical protein
MALLLILRVDRRSRYPRGLSASSEGHSNRSCIGHTCVHWAGGVNLATSSALLPPSMSVVRII